VRITVESDMPGVQFLHWGIVPWGPFGDNHWQPPPEELRPPVRGQCVGKSQNDESFTQLTSFCWAQGTRAHDKTAVQTPLLPAGAGDVGAAATATGEQSKSGGVATSSVSGKIVIQCAATDAPRAINFVLHEPTKNVWTHTAGGKVFFVPLPPRSAALLAAAQASAAQRSGIQSLLNTLNSFIQAADAASGDVDSAASGTAGGGQTKGVAAVAGDDAGWEVTHQHVEAVTAQTAALQRVGVRVTSHSAGAGVRLRVESDLPMPLLLHWGVVPRGARDDLWAVPEQHLWPPGSVLYKRAAQDRAVQSPMHLVEPQAPPAGAASAPLGKTYSYIDLEVGTDPASVRFVLKEANGPSWFDNDGSDFTVQLPELAPEAMMMPPSQDQRRDGVSTVVDTRGMPAASGPNSLLRPDGAPGPQVVGTSASAAAAAAAAAAVASGAMSAEELARLEDLRRALEEAERTAAAAAAAKAAALAAAQDASGQSAPALAGVRARRLAAEANAAARAAAEASARAGAAMTQAARTPAGSALTAELNAAAAAAASSGVDTTARDATAAAPLPEELAAAAWAGFAGREPAAWHSDAARAAARAEAERLEWLAAQADAERRATATAAQQAKAMEQNLIKRAAEAAAAPKTPPRDVPTMPPPVQVTASAAVADIPRQDEDLALSPPLAVPDSERNSGTGSGREILLQGFNWESSRKGGWYNHLASKAEAIAALGATVVWLPPPTDSVSSEGYMPRDLYDLNSRYGTLAELRACVAALHGVGLKVLGDAVLNHRCAHAQDANGVWNRFGGRLAWDARAIVSDDPHFAGRGNPSQGDHFHAAPNIDHSQEFVRKDIRNWLAWLRDSVGYDGWRLDFVRGFSGHAVREYLQHTGPSFAVGEYWDTLAYHHAEPEHCQDAHRQRIVNWVNAAGGLAGAFDVTTKGILHAALERREYWRLCDAHGKPPGVLGWWPSRAVTFLENHDTGSTQGHWRFPSGKELQGYAYILTHPGTPTLFFDHVFEWPHLAEPIRRLTDLRKRAGVHCRSEVRILVAERDVYVAQVDDRLICKLGPGHWEPDGSRWQRAEGGSDWTVYEPRP